MKKLKQMLTVSLMAVILLFGSVVAFAETDNKVREMGGFSQETDNKVREMANETGFVDLVAGIIAKISIF